MRVVLAVLLLSAVAVAGDKPGTFKEVKAAAEGGDKNAQHNLGVMYDNGEGVPEDDAEAVKWWLKAAEQGLADAQYSLGFMYANGEGVPKDYAESCAWVSIAATNGVEDAKKGLAKVRAELSPDQLAEYQKRATELFEQINASKAR